MNRGDLSRREFIRTATGLALFGSYSNAQAQRDLFPDGNITVFEKRRNVSFKLEDVMPVKYKKFNGTVSLDVYVGETGTECFKLHLMEVTGRIGKFFLDQGVKTDVHFMRRKLHRYTSATSMGIELLSPEAFDKRMSDLHINAKSIDYSGHYGGAQRMAFCRAGKEYTSPTITAKLMTHEILHGFSLMHPDSFEGMEDDGGVMSRAPIEKQTFDSSLPIGQTLSERQVAQLHSFLGKENPYWAFLKANYDSNSLALEIEKASGLRLNARSMNK